MDVAASGQPADTVDTVLSYENIVKAVRAIVATGHFHLIETLAEKVAAECLTHYMVSSVKVKIELLDKDVKVLP